MTTVVAMPSAASLPPMDCNPSPRPYPTLAPSTTVQSFERAEISRADSAMNPTAERSPSDGRKSPRSSRGPPNSKIVVKKEPGSPPLQNARHRPRKLDLNTISSTGAAANNVRPSAATPLTGREGLVMQDVGLACLSPGFQTQDPTMREQINRSISVRDQQRSIIEARLLKSAKGDGPDRSQEPGKAALSNSKKRPPPGLSIVPPPAQQFASERVIQSAPLNQTFTGHNQGIPGARPGELPAQHYGQNSQVQHVPTVQNAVQNFNRLPPISDVFGADALQPMASRPQFQHSNSTPSHNGPPLPSPGFPPQTAHPGFSQSGRNREYRSAEEAVYEMTGGREDLQPKLVRIGGHQPPTPPSPKNENHTPHKAQYGSITGASSRRRSRNEYEGDSSPPLGAGRIGGPQTGPFGEGRDSPATIRAKKEEFLSLCSRAWDLFHS